MIIFDIETGPLSDEELVKICPPFTEDDVKTGNIKDPEKIKAKIEEAREKHFESFRDNAPFDASTGRVVAIGIWNTKGDLFLPLTGEEKGLLEAFWRLAGQCMDAGVEMVGHNIFDFDLPFLVRRSWILSVAIPTGTVDLKSKWCNWHRVFMDTRTIWQLGNRQATSSFDRVGRALGTGGKCAGDHGAHFYKLVETDPDAAIEYLKQDVQQPAKWLKTFGLL